MPVEGDALGGGRGRGHLTPGKVAEKSEAQDGDGDDLRPRSEEAGKDRSEQDRELLRRRLSEIEQFIALRLESMRVTGKL